MELPKVRGPLNVLSVSWRQPIAEAQVQEIWTKIRSPKSETSSPKAVVFFSVLGEDIERMQYHFDVQVIAGPANKEGNIEIEYVRNPPTDPPAGFLERSRRFGPIQTLLPNLRTILGPPPDAEAHASADFMFPSEAWRRTIRFPSADEVGWATSAGEAFVQSVRLSVPAFDTLYGVRVGSHGRVESGTHVKVEWARPANDLLLNLSSEYGRAWQLATRTVAEIGDAGTRT